MRRRMFLVSSSIVAGLLAGPEPASAQGRARVGGIVTELESKRPLAGVTVTIVGTAYGAQTNEEGRYAILNAPEGVITIEARRIGFGARRV